MPSRNTKKSATRCTKSRRVYASKHPMTSFPDEPDEAYKQVIIRAALEEAYQALPPRDGIVDVAKQQLQEAIDFVIERDIVEMPEEPVEIIIMPEFQRGVALAYLDPPGPLDREQPEASHDRHGRQNQRPPDPILVLPCEPAHGRASTRDL